VLSFDRFVKKFTFCVGHGSSPREETLTAFVRHDGLAVSVLLSRKGIGMPRRSRNVCKKCNVSRTLRQPRPQGIMFGKRGLKRQ
jgi:hypothetical protein